MERQHLGKKWSVPKRAAIFPQIIGVCGDRTPNLAPEESVSVRGTVLMFLRAVSLSHGGPRPQASFSHGIGAAVVKLPAAYVTIYDKELGSEQKRRACFQAARIVADDAKKRMPRAEYETTSPTSYFSPV